MFKISNIE